VGGDGQGRDSGGGSRGRPAAGCGSRVGVLSAVIPAAPFSPALTAMPSLPPSARELIELEDFAEVFCRWVGSRSSWQLGSAERIRVVTGEGELQEGLRWEVIVEPWLAASAEARTAGEIGDTSTARGGRREEKWKPEVNARQK